MRTDALDLCMAVGRAHASLQLKLDDQLGTWHGVSLADFLLLRELAAAPGERLPLADLVRPTGLRPSALLRLVLPLEKTGLVERLPGRVIALRPAGRTKAQDAAATAAAICAAALRPVDAATTTALTHGLAVLAHTRARALT